MRFSRAGAVALSFQLTLAHPTWSARRALVPSPDAAGTLRPHVVDLQGFQADPARDLVKGASVTALRSDEAAAAGKAAEGASGKEGAKENTEEDEKGDEEDIAGALDTPLALKGGDVKQDVTFPAVYMPP